MDADLEKILRKEEHPLLWEPFPETATIPVWPLLRFEVITHLYYLKKKDLQTPALPPAPASWWRKKTHRIRSAFYDPMRQDDSPADAVFFTKGKSLLPGPAGNWTHPYADRLIKVCGPQSIVIEKSHLATLRPKGRPCRFRSYEPIEKRAHALSRSLRKSANLASRSEAFVKKIEGLFAQPLDEQTRQRWKARVHETAAKMRAFEDLHDRLFQIGGFKIAILEDAHYGDTALLVRSANRKGVITGELQHGILNENHTAYAMSSKTRAQLDKLGMLPKNFLVWGRFWGQTLDPSIRAIPVGKDGVSPRREVPPARGAKDKRLLVISSGCSLKLWNDLLPLITADLSALGWRIRFRPHPSERSAASDLFPLRPPVELDPYPRLADSLSEASVVLGDFSTVLYEAAEAGVPVILWENEGSRLYSDPGLGVQIRRREELVEILRTGQQVPSKINPNDLIDPNGLDHFRNFLKENGVQLA